MSGSPTFDTEKKIGTHSVHVGSLHHAIYQATKLGSLQTSQLCRKVKSETGNCASHVDILGYKLMFRALYKTVLFSEFIYIALKCI